MPLLAIRRHHKDAAEATHRIQGGEPCQYRYRRAQGARWDARAVSYGVSVLCTQHLYKHCYSTLPQTDSSPNIIQSYHWVVEDADYFSTHDDPFCFGRHRCLSDVGKRLRRLVGKDHPAILVVYGGHRETTIQPKTEYSSRPNLHHRYNESCSLPTLDIL
jgi:hypothetical protein